MPSVAGLVRHLTSFLQNDMFSSFSGYKPILMEVTPSVPTTPKQGMPPATPSRSSERLRARQEAGPSGSISDELDRLWSSGKNPRRELSFSRRDPKDGEQGMPVSDTGHFV